MSSAVVVVKATEYPGDKVPWNSFAEAIEAGVIGVTNDAQSVLLDLDNETKHLVLIREVRYLLLSVERQKNMQYFSQLGKRLLRKGWPIFLDHRSFLSFVCGGFKGILPSSCKEVSVPLFVNGGLQPLIVTFHHQEVVIDAHPFAFATFADEWLGRSPLERGENILLLR